MRQIARSFCLGLILLGPSCSDLPDTPGHETSSSAAGGAAGSGAAGAAGANPPMGPSTTATGSGDAGHDGAREASVDDGTAGQGGAGVDAARSDGARSDEASIEDARPEVALAGDASGSCAGTSPGTALFCDDFEAGNLSSWKVLESGGTFAIDQAHAYGGRSSVNLTIPANMRGGFIEKTGAPLFPLVNDTNWGRMMVYFESMASLHFDTIRAAPVGGGTPWYNIGGQYKKVLLNYYSGNDDCAGYPSPNPTIVTNQWSCWEWKYDGSKNEMDFWIDGNLVMSVVDKGTTCVTGGTPSWAAPTFGTIRLGEYNAQTESSQTRMWMDDIALGTTGRIGCPPASAGAH